MSEGTISIKKAIPIIVITWILSLATTLAIAYFTPFIPIKTSQIDDSAVTADKIVDGAIITAKLANGTVTSAKILDGTLTAEDISDGAIITVKVADGAVTTEKIADGAVTADEIANGAIVTIKLADGSVTSAKIQDGTVTAVDLADGSIITAKIANGAVTTEKIADGAVTTSKIADGNITNIKLAAGAIPMWSNFSGGNFSFTSTTWINDTDITANITLSRTSDLLIMYSTEAWMSGTGDFIIIRVLVNATDAYPQGIHKPVLLSSANQPGEFSAACATRIFYLMGVSAGTYIVQVQYYMWNGVTTGTVTDRTLNVIAFPT